MIDCLFRDKLIAFYPSFNHPIAPRDLSIRGGFDQKINIFNEIRGKSEFIKHFCDLSRQANGLFMVGASVNFGKIYPSAIILHKGKLIDITSQTSTSQNTVKVYRANGQSYGVLVSDDIYSEKAVKTISNKCDIIIGVDNACTSVKREILANFARATPCSIICAYADTVVYF
ncbi:MAG: hypothetical protein IJY70_04790 [Clostridia bacterium]|nr:hypothetical protein [Clostridia bacterium]